MIILIVDDSEVFRSRLIELLSVKKNSKNFFEANNILEAKEIMLDILPDVVITDIRMPGGSGLDLIRDFRKENLATVTMVITNYAESQYKIEALKAGANYFFDKSQEMELLVKTINELNKKVGS